MAKRRGKTSSRRGQSRGRKSASRIMPQAAVRATSSKMGKVVKNLIVFLALFVVSFVLYKVTTNVFWDDLFFLLMLVTGFVALAFLIVWLVLWWLKAIGK